MSDSFSFKDVQENISSALVNTTRVVGQISNEDLDFHRSVDPTVGPLLEQQSARLLSLARSLTKAVTSETDVAAPKITDRESVDDNWKGLVEVLDSLLEKTDACLDEFTGSIKKQEQSDIPNAPIEPSRSDRHRSNKYDRVQTIPKPQLLFQRGPQNHETAAFKPLLQSKPHAIEPIQESLTTTEPADPGARYKHPYEVEIRHLRYPDAAFARAEPIPYLSFQETQATWVDTMEAVLEMLADLKDAKEIAIDLEHHDEHSYIGIVSLMQISTRQKDWIVDTLKPWRHELQILNEVFADPQIIKILHGSFMDMIWLQRDLGLYVVGLFDTFHAASLLHYERRSLAYLLKRFVNFDAAKQYQTADWRTRPLPEAMFDYARSDTHFLLYVYDNVRNELLDQSDPSKEDGNLVEVVMNRSKEEALQRYERPIYDLEKGQGSMGWFNLLYRTPALFNSEQFAVFRAVHQWRDKVARQEDENPHQVMPKHAIFSIARATPMDMPSLMGCSHPMSRFFQSRKDELLGIVKRAKLKGATGPDMKDVLHSLGVLTITNEEKTNALPLVPTGSQLVPPIGSTGEVPVSLPLRMSFSSFWGNTISRSSDSLDQIGSVVDQNVELALPLPALTAEIWSDSYASVPNYTPSQSSPNIAEPGALAQHPYVKDRQQQKGQVPDVVMSSGGSEIFTLKNSKNSRSLKRKAGDHIDSPTPTRHFSNMNGAAPSQTRAQVAPAPEKIDLDGSNSPMLSPSAAMATETTAAAMMDEDESDRSGEQAAVGNSHDPESLTSANSNVFKSTNKRSRNERRKRRRLEQNAAERNATHNASNGGDVALNSSTTPRSGSKKGRADQREEEDQQPFDYANAPSVLNAASHETSSGGNGRSRQGGGKNPYAKALNTSTGLGKARGRKETVGRSATFKK